jgi:hypothetical protein
VITARDAQAPRAPGLHVSQIVDDISLTLGWHKAGATPGGDGGIGPSELFWEFGNAWEDTYATGLRLIYGGDKPAPRQVDGVWGSPDWRRPLGRLDEIKLTWTSSAKSQDHPKILKYLYQLQAYMWMWEQEVGYLHVGYVRGNYADKLVDLRSWKVEFSEQQLRQHWKKLLVHAEDRGWR